MKSSEVRKADDQSDDIIRVWIKLENQWISDISEKMANDLES